MLPVADPDRLMGVPGVEAAAVLPLNLFEPVAIFATTETSFHWPAFIWVKLPFIAPDPKFTEIEALPPTPEV